MALLDEQEIKYRAFWVRKKMGYDKSEPAYSTKKLLDALYPHIPVAGTELPKGVSEMAVHQRGCRALYYARGLSAGVQRLGLMHGLYHHMSDLSGDAEGIRECNLSERQFMIRRRVMVPEELACDLFAGEVLLPFVVLDKLIDFDPFPRDAEAREAAKDKLDNLASLFKVPVGFLNWRVYDLLKARGSHFNPET